MHHLVTKVIQSKKEAWVVTLGIILCIMIALYVYLLSASVVHVVIRQEVQQSIKNQHSVISSLESSYIKAQHQLSANVANLDGYAKAEEKIFIHRNGSSLVLSAP